MLTPCIRRILVMAILAGWLPAANAENDALRFEVPALPALQRHVDLLARPGYLAIALENNGLSPSVSSKLKVSEQGRAAEIRNASIRFTGEKGAVYSYEASILFGVGDSKLSIPVTVDASSVDAGKVTVTITPPLATFIPREFTDRLRIKIQLIANANAQQRVLDYLDAMLKHASTSDALIEAILLDGYNKSGSFMRYGERDIGDAVPLSEQWLLILTLVIWLVVVPGYLLLLRFRRSRRAQA